MSMKDATGTGIEKRKSLRERIETHFIVILAATCFSVGSIVAGVMHWVQIQREDRLKGECAQNLDATERKYSDILTRYRHVFASDESTLIQYDNHIIDQPREFPGVQPEVYKGDVLRQPSSNTEYFETPKDEPPLETLKRLQGVQPNENNTKSEDRSLVWIGKTYWNISYTNKEKHGYKKLFPYISITREKRQYRFDDKIVSILQNRFGLQVEEEKQLMSITNMYISPKRVLALEIRTLLPSVKINDGPVKDVYLLERLFVFPTEYAVVTVKEFIPSETARLQDRKFIEARRKWWSFFGVYKQGSFSEGSKRERLTHIIPRVGRDQTPNASISAKRFNAETTAISR